MTAILSLLTDLLHGPRWARSFDGFKGVVTQAIDDGLVARVAPDNGNAKNMLSLTGRGRAMLDACEVVPALVVPVVKPEPKQRLRSVPKVTSVQEEPLESQRVQRDPCFYCGSRGDLQCAHRG